MIPNRYAVPDYFDENQCVEYEIKCRAHLASLLERYKVLHSICADLLCDEYARELGQSVTPDVSKLVSARHEIYTIIEPVCKHILARFSYEYDPKNSWPYSSTPNDGHAPHMLGWNVPTPSFPCLLDAVQSCLLEHNTGENLELAVLNEGLNARNDAVHKSVDTPCMSFIRIANVLRDMLCFLAPEVETGESSLPEFSYPEACKFDFQKLLGAYINNEDFRDKNTILVTCGLHDIKQEQRALLANLPWRVVIDLDATSEHGGLLSACNSEVNVRDFDEKNVATFVNDSFLKSTQWFLASKSILKFYPDGQHPLFDDLELPYNARDYLSSLGRAFRTLFEYFGASVRYTSILCVTGDTSLIGQLKKFVPTDSYSMACVYSYASRDVYRIQPDFGLPEDERFEPIDVFNTNLNYFFQCLVDYVGQLPVASQPCGVRQIPGHEGLVTIDKESENALSRYFEPLYSDIGRTGLNDKTGTFDCALDDFTYGRGVAPWGAIERKDRVADLMDFESVEWQQFEGQIRANLSSFDDKAQYVFHVNHAPGMGGSTLLRQIGWRLHDDYPVLLVTRKYSDNMEELLRSQVHGKLKKGIVLLADNDYPNGKKLEKMVSSIRDFPCVLIAARRMTQSQLQTVNEANSIDLMSLDAMAFSKVKEVYRNFSRLKVNLTDSEIKKLDESCDRLSGEERCPFFIGMTYLTYLSEQKYLDSVNEYINKALTEIENDENGAGIIRVIRYVALLDLYAPDGKMPALFADYVAGATLWPSRCSAFGEIISRNDGNYKMRHPFFSEYILRNYAGNSQPGETRALYEISAALVGDVFRYLETNSARKLAAFSEYLLKPLFLKRQGEFSPSVQKLIDCGHQDYACALLERIAPRMEDFAYRAIGDERFTTMKYAARAHAYLSHLYYKTEKNTDYTRACREAEKAVECMKLSGKLNGAIFHVAGEAFAARAMERLSVWQGNTEMDDEALQCLELDIDEALNCYEEAAHRMTTPCSLCRTNFDIADLLIKYLEAVLKIFEGYTQKQIGYLAEIPKYLYFDFEFDEDSPGNESFGLYRELFVRYRALTAECSNGQGTIIAYYQNKLDQMKGRAELSEMNAVRVQLITAILDNYKDEQSDYYVNWGRLSTDQKTLGRVSNLLDTILRTGLRLSKAHEYRTVFNTWMEVAKLCNRSLEDANEVVDKWLDIPNLHDPSPYYYRCVIGYLRLLNDDANKTDRQALDFNRTIVDKSAFEGLNAKTIRDYFVKGKGMGQLCSSRVFGRTLSPDDLKSGLTSKCRVIRGQLKYVDVRTGVATVAVTEPTEWSSKDITVTVKFNLIEANTMQKEQVGCAVNFLGGFSYEGICADDRTITDATHDEQGNVQIDFNPLELSELENAALKVLKLFEMAGLSVELLFEKFKAKSVRNAEFKMRSDPITEYGTTPVQSCFDLPAERPKSEVRSVSEQSESHLRSFADTPDPTVFSPEFSDLYAGAMATFLPGNWPLRTDSNGTIFLNGSIKGQDDVLSAITSDDIRRFLPLAVDESEVRAILEDLRMLKEIEVKIIESPQPFTTRMGRYRCRISLYESGVSLESLRDKARAVAVFLESGRLKIGDRVTFIPQGIYHNYYNGMTYLNGGIKNWDDVLCALTSEELNRLSPSLPFTASDVLAKLENLSEIPARITDVHPPKDIDGKWHYFISIDETETTLESLLEEIGVVIPGQVATVQTEPTELDTELAESKTVSLPALDSKKVYKFVVGTISSSTVRGRLCLSEDEDYPAFLHKDVLPPRQRNALEPDVVLQIKGTAVRPTGDKYMIVSV